MNCFKKILWAILFSFIGIIGIPIITLPIHPSSILAFDLSLFMILLGYFLPGTVFLMLLIGEFLKRIPFLNPLYFFVSSKGIYRLFLLSVLVCWAFSLWLPPSNDLVFGSQFVTGLILPFHFYTRKNSEILCY